MRSLASYLTIVALALAAPIEAGAARAPTPAASASLTYETLLAADPVLARLIADAGDVDDVAIARARLAEAEALRRAARATLFPALTVSGDAVASAAEDVAGAGRVSGGVSLAGPLDIAGAERSRAGAARARVAAADADLAQARLAARRTAGQLYATLRTAQTQRAAAQRQAEAAEDSFALAAARADAGLESGLALAQARTAAESARARIAPFAQAETAARLGLEALLGQRPGGFAQRLAPVAMVAIDVTPLLDAPARLLAERPDVRAAEARLAAAGLDARAARADRWPTARLSLAATQTSLSRPFGVAADGGLAEAGLSLAATVFDFGRLKALADSAGARAQALAVEHRRTVTYALSDVAREQDRYARAREEARSYRTAAEAARDQVDLARARYASGLVSFIEVQVADRAYADAEIAQAAADGRANDAAIALAAALGLGAAP